MSKRTLPKVGAWFDTGARTGHMNEYPTLEAAIAGEGVPHEAVDAFTRGYLRGQITDPIEDFSHWLKYMDNDQLARLGGSLRKLRDEFNSELSKSDATYKVKGVFDQYG